MLQKFKSSEFLWADMKKEYGYLLSTKYDDWMDYQTQYGSDYRLKQMR